MNKQQNKFHQLFIRDGAIFMGAKRSFEGCNLALFGVPYDGTTSFRPGTRFGPAAIREVSNGLETYCPKMNLDLSQLNFVDLGALDIPYGAPEPVIEIVKNATKEILQLGMKPIILGGEHSISSGAVSATAEIYSDLILVQLDAHADLREEWMGSRHSHACAMTRCLEVLPSKKLFQIGIRSGTREEFQQLQKRLIPISFQEPANNLEKTLQPFSGYPIYLTIDLDWFDPSVMPGTGTPEPGGFFWREFEAIIEVLNQHKIIGADIVELSPQLDSSGISNILAAKVARTLIMLLGK